MKIKIILVLYTKYKFIVFPSVVVLACLILTAFVIIPQLSALLTNSKKQTELLRQASALGLKAEELSKKDKRELQNNLSALLQAFPTERDFGNILVLISEVSQKYGFNIDSFDLAGIGKSSKSAKAQSYTVNLSVSGPKELLSQFLSELEDGKRIISIDTISVNSGRASGGIEAGLVLIVYYSPSPASFGTFDTPLPVLSSQDKEYIARLVSLNSTADTSSEQVENLENIDPVINVPLGKENPFE